MTNTSNPARNTARVNPQKGPDGPRRLVTVDRRTRQIERRTLVLAAKLRLASTELLRSRLEPKVVADLEEEQLAGTLSAGVWIEQVDGVLIVSVLGVDPMATDLSRSELLTSIKGPA